MAVIDLGDNGYVNPHGRAVGDKLKDVECPGCDGMGTLEVQEQEGRTGHELYLECTAEHCGCCYYPEE